MKNVLEVGLPLFLFLTAMGLYISASVLTAKMVTAINLKLPENEQVDHFYWYLGKILKVNRLYKQFYPESRAVTVWYWCLGLGGIFLLTFAWRLGFFR